MLADQRADFCYLQIPSSWEQPLYHLGQTVMVRNSSATVIGVVCFSVATSVQSQAEPGWHYCLAFHAGTSMWQSWQADGVFAESEVNHQSFSHSAIHPVLAASVR